MLAGSAVTAQVKLGTNPATINAGSILELESNTKGLLLTRVVLTSTTTYTPVDGTPVNGMVVYNTNATITGSTAAPAISGGVGTYYWDGTRWVGTAATNMQNDFWRINGNAGTTPPTTVGTAAGTANYWGTTDAKNLAVGTNGTTRVIYDQNNNMWGGGTLSKVTSTGGGNLVWGSLDTVKGSGIQNAIFGGGNVTSGNNSIIGGSFNKSNTTDGIIAGASNSDSSSRSMVVGNSNIITANGQESIVGGGSNIVNAIGSIVSGVGNRDTATYSIMSGQSNSLSSSSNSSIVSGATNLVTNSASGIFSGYGNRIATATGSLVLGGDNIVNGAGGNSVSQNGIYAGNSNNVYGAVSSAVLGTGNTDSAKATLVVGEQNKVGAGAFQSIVAGGNNRVNAAASIVSGTDNVVNPLLINANAGIVVGSKDTVFANSSAVFGNKNIDSASFTLVAGQSNKIGTGGQFGGQYSAVVGFNNSINGTSNLVSGAQNNINSLTSSDLCANNAVFGNANILTNVSHSIVGGQYNTAYKPTSTGDGWMLVAGQNNQDSATYTVVGGRNNTLAPNATLSAVFGGGMGAAGNYLSGASSGVFGSSNKDSSSSTFIAGSQNSISMGAPSSSIVGQLNKILTGGFNSHIIGQGNQVGAPNSFAVGYQNTLAGGNGNGIASLNFAFGDNNMLANTTSGAFVSGSGNTVAGSGSVVFGSSAVVASNHFNCFVAGAGITTTASDQFVAKYFGGYNLFSNSSATTGVSLASGGTSWASISDRRSKDNIKNISYGLTTVMALRPTMYNYKGNKNTSLGFIAQEVKEVVPEVIEQTTMGPDHGLSCRKIYGTYPCTYKSHSGAAGAD